MTFQQFVDAAKSAWGAVNNFTIIAAFLAVFGINLVFPSVPGPIAVLACLLFYLVGFLVSCYKIAERSHELAAKDDEIAELSKRPTQEDMDELRRQLSTKDAEIAALRSTKVPTPLDMLKASLGDEGIASFRALCAASTYVDGKPARPLVFDLDDEKLSAIGLTEGAVRRMADAGAIRLAASDDRVLVGSNACAEMVDIGEGVAASSGAVRFSLAGGDVVEVAPVHLSHGTDFFVVDSHLAGADLGIASFTANGSELASECAALKPPLGMDAYIADAYSADMRASRHGFRCLTKDGELKRP